MTNQIITLTSDFGIGSPYVAQMKGAAYSVNPAAVLVDITHQIPPQDIRSGAIVLAEVTSCFPDGTVHVGVVDPGVGTERRIVVAKIAGHFFVAPDNGLLGLLAEQHDSIRVVTATVDRFWRSPVSATFHGRDIMAPIAAHLTMGVDIRQFGPEQPDGALCGVELPKPRTTSDEIQGEILNADSFGNLITNIRQCDLPTQPRRQDFVIAVKNRTIRGLVQTYGQRQPGDLVALLGSTSRLEISVVNGSAEHELGIGPGTPVRVTWQ